MSDPMEILRRTAGDREPRLDVVMHHAMIAVHLGDIATALKGISDLCGAEPGEDDLESDELMRTMVIDVSRIIEPLAKGMALSLASLLRLDEERRRGRAANSEDG